MRVTVTIIISNDILILYNKGEFFIKKSKILLSILLVLLLLVTTTMPCFATQSDYNYLLSCGFTENFLNDLPEINHSRIREMIGNNDVTNTSINTYYLHESSTTTRGAIDPNHLELQMAVSEICESGTNNINLYLVAATWKWEKDKPRNKLNEDAITVNWNADLLNLAITGAFYAQDWYKNSQNGEEIVVRETTICPTSAQGGIGFYTELEQEKSFVGGSMLLLLESSIPMTTGNTYSSTINIEYAHDYSIANLSGLGFTISVVSVNLDFSGFCDTMAAHTNIYYS